MADLLILPGLADDAPAGPNLELDDAFGAMERAAKGKSESQYGNTIEAAVPPDWQETATLAEALMSRTHDLRVMVMYAMARLHLQGLPAYAETVSLIRRSLETLWEHLHPQLDPEDDNDPLQRANALLLLQDPIRVLRPLRDLPLASVARTGTVSWRDIAVLNGTLEPEAGREKLSETVIRATFAGTDPMRLAGLRAAVDSLLADLAAIAAAFDHHATIGSGPDLKDITRLARDIGKELARFTPEPAEPTMDQPVADAVAEAMSVNEEPGRAIREHGKASIKSIHAINTRDDALRALELAAAYFRTNEPSSPLPLLIDRALQLAPLPFLDILRNLAPDGLLQAQIVVGKTDE